MRSKDKDYRGNIMEQPVYTKVKVNNEIEFCEVKTMDAKEHVEKALLKARVSYYIRWKKPGFFSNDRKEKCIFHINSQQIEPAFQAMETAGLDTKVKYLIKKED